MQELEAMLEAERASRYDELAAMGEELEKLRARAARVEPLENALRGLLRNGNVNSTGTPPELLSAARRALGAHDRLCAELVGFYTDTCDCGAEP